MFGKRKTPRGGFLLLALAAATFASNAQADEPEALAVYHPELVPPTAARTKLYLAGGGLFAASYGAAIGFSYLWEQDPGSTDLRIPVVGPWMKVGRTTLCVAETDGCSNALQVVGAIGAGFDGVFQVAALALLVDAMLVPVSTAPTSGAISPGTTAHTGERSWVRAMPVLGQQGVGVSVFGAF
jgi:hypothetical protein